MADLFDHPDPRLRPHSSLEAYSVTLTRIDGKPTLVPTSYKVTATSFPQLYTRFTELKARAGVATAQLVIKPDSDRIYYSDRVIFVGLNALLQHSFRTLEFALSHELGHAWRDQSPNVSLVAMRAPLTHGQATESEADVFARCLTKDKEGAVEALRRLTPPRDAVHATPSQRVAVVESALPEDCGHFGLSPAVPKRTLREQKRSP